MSFYNYSLQYASDKSGRAQGYDLNASYKDLTQVASAIKGLPVEKARAKLEDCIEMRRPIAFRKFAKGMGHRSQLGGKRGKFPKKECRLVLQLLENAVSNASGKGLDGKNLVVLHACAFKQNVFPRYRKFFAGSNTLGYGKQAIYSSYVTARAEVIVGEKDAPKLGLRRGRKDAKTKDGKKAEPAKRQAGQAKKQAEKDAGRAAGKEAKISKEEVKQAENAAEKEAKQEKQQLEKETIQASKQRELTAERLFEKKTE